MSASGERPTKLTIKRREGNKVITALFNPTSYSIVKPVTYTSHPNSSLDVPLLNFGGGGSRTLSLRLFFDVTDLPRPRDVRKLTNDFVELTRIQANGARPPVCYVSWGNSSSSNPDLPFPGVVTNLVQEFTLFESDGTPLRANLTVDFREFEGWEENQRRTDPEFTTHVVKRGDTLSSVAAAMYDDPRLWRIIADANHLDDPRRLQVARVLSIPKIT